MLFSEQWGDRTARSIQGIQLNPHLRLDGEVCRVAIFESTRPDSGDFSEETSMKELVENILKALVDYPSAVHVNAVEGTEVTVLELTHPDDRRFAPCSEPGE